MSNPNGTEHYGLIKQPIEDFYDRALDNGNLDAIDALIKALETAKANGTDLISLRDVVTTHLAQTTMHTTAADKQAIANALSVVNEGYNVDPNTTTAGHILTSHANGPSAAFWYIVTFFYSERSVNANRFQIAYRYNGGNEMAIRRYFNGVWSNWSPYGDPAELKTIGKSFTLGINELHTSLANLVTSINTHFGKSASSAHGDLRKEYVVFEGSAKAGSVMLTMPTGFANINAFDEVHVYGLTRSNVTSEVQHHSHTFIPFLVSNYWYFGFNQLVLYGESSNYTASWLRAHINMLTSTLVINYNREKALENTNAVASTNNEIYRIVGVKYD